MSPPNKISSPLRPAVVYDESQKVCRPAEPGEPGNVSVAPSKPAFSISHSRLLYETRHRRSGHEKKSSPWPSILLVPLTGAMGCNGSDKLAAPGHPVLFMERLGDETAMNSKPISGNINEYALSGAGARTVAAWSVFDGANLAQSGTFAYLRSGDTGGSQVTVSSDASALHKFTSAAALDNGDTFVSYTLTKGTEVASSIVVQRLSGTGTPQLPILASGVRPGTPEAQLVSTGTGFVAVYRDGRGQLFAAAFDGSGAPQGAPQNLGPILDGDPFFVSRGTGDRWVLAQKISSNQIRIRTFSGVKPGGVAKPVTIGGFSSTPKLSVAMADTGAMMLAWTTPQKGISAAVMNSGGDVQGDSFVVTSSSSSDPSGTPTLSLAPDHQGNFVLAWELIGTDPKTGQRIGQIVARIYDGTSHYQEDLAELSFISDPTMENAANVQAHVGDSGILTLTWIRSSIDGTQGVVRRDYQLYY